VIDGVRVASATANGDRGVTGFWHPVQFSRSGLGLAGFRP
jgi:hypothetical protein